MLSLQQRHGCVHTDVCMQTDLLVGIARHSKHLIVIGRTGHARGHGEQRHGEAAPP